MEAAVEYETEEVVETEEVETAEAEEVGEESAPSETEEVETVESTGEEAKEPEVVEEPEKPKKDNTQRRIDRLTKARREAEERAEELEKRLKEISGPVSNEPQEDQFDTYQDYVEALTDYKADQKRAAERRQEHEKAVQQAQAAAQQQLNAQLDAGRSKYDDFDEVALRPPMEGGPVVTQAMLDAMQAGDMLSDLAYHFGQNKEEAARIASLPPVAQIREVTLLEAQLKQPKPAPRKKVTKAPEPIKPVGSTATVQKAVSDMTDAEYAAWRRQGR